MRTCPKCGRTFHQEYNFCLSDGTLLSNDAAANKTEVFSSPTAMPDSVPTVDAHKRDEPAPTIKVPISTPEPAMPTIAAFTPKPITKQPAKPGRSIAQIVFSILLAVFGVIIVLALIAGIVIGIVESSSRQNIVAVANTTPSFTPTPVLKATATPSISPTPIPTPEPTPTRPIIIPNPTLDPKDEVPQFPKIEGRYNLREYQGDGDVLTYLDVYDQSGPDFYVHDTADDIYGTVHLDHTQKNEWIGYVAWEYASGSKDREIIYICEDWKGLCGKLPGISWYFVATKGK